MVLIFATLVASLAIGWAIAGPLGAVLAWVAGTAFVLIFAVARAAFDS